MIKAENISKSFGLVKALHSVSLTVKENELFGLIGPDGAGKSTLFRILATLLIPDQGKASVIGYDTIKNYRQIRMLLGYMPGRFSLYPDLTVEENLAFYASVFGTSVRQHYQLIEPVYKQLEPFRNRRAAQLSGGMKQKLALSCALIHRPKILLLDEPTTGVDAVSRKEFWELLSGIRQAGITILVSTPYMDEANLCDRIALFQDGQILSIDTPANIVADYELHLCAVKAPDKYLLLKTLRSWPNTYSAYPFGDAVHLSTTYKINNNELKQYLTHHALPGSQIMSINAGIEDRFLELLHQKTLTHA